MHFVPVSSHRSTTSAGKLIAEQNNFGGIAQAISGVPKVLPQKLHSAEDSKPAMREFGADSD